jgi:excisionase family DNA binding protein
MSDEQLLTVEQVAKQMQVHVETVRVWIRRGELIAINIGNEYRITRSDLNDFLERRKTDKGRKDS